MKALDLFLIRYHVLYDFWLHFTWEDVPAEMMRQRPQPTVNSIAWNFWHLTRVEDAALNRFIADQPQVLDDGWYEKMEVPLRHNGSEMTKAQVDELSQQIDLDALRGYSNAVHARTLQVVSKLREDELAEVVPWQRIEQVLLADGLAGPGTEGLLEAYSGWRKADFLMNHGLTHPYHHVGETNVIASLSGLVF